MHYIALKFHYINLPVISGNIEHRTIIIKHEYDMEVFLFTLCFAFEGRINNFTGSGKPGSIEEMYSVRVDIGGLGENTGFYAPAQLGGVDAQFFGCLRNGHITVEFINCGACHNSFMVSL